MMTEISDEELDAWVAGMLGWWVVEGDLYQVTPSPNGGMLAFQQDGTPISPRG